MRSLRSKSPQTLMIEKQEAPFDSRFATKVEAIKPTDTSGQGVYFIGAMGADLIKIGWVLKMERLQDRIAKMATDCPYPVIALMTLPGADRIHEGRLHKRFQSLHHHGEWFRWDGDLKDFLLKATEDPETAAAEMMKSLRLTF